jgi:AcrR family transcriptional regulator
MSDTKERLKAAAIEVLRDKGLAGLSARTIATAADANQALIFYHFGSVDALIDEACGEATRRAVAAYGDRFAQVKTLGELLGLGREIHVQEREAGNVTVMAQVLAGAHSSESLAQVGKGAIGLWVGEIEPVLARVLKGSPIEAVANVHGLARGVAASFVGLELYEGVDPDAATAALDALEQLAILADVVDDFGPLARKALQVQVRKRRKR